MPQSIEESLSYTGIFLERAVTELIKSVDGFIVTREFPYTVKANNKVLDGNVDVVAAKKVDGFVLCLVIECKREYKNYKKWVLESDPDVDPKNFPLVYYENSEQGPLKKINYGKNLILPSLNYKRIEDYEHAIQVFEYNNSNSGNTNTQDKSYNALLHVNEALTGIAQNPYRIRELIGNVPILFIPVVVTTAELLLADYDHSKISLASGTIDPSKIKLLSKNWAEYIFPLKESIKLQGFIDNSVGLLPSKRITYIVNSASLETFIQGLSSDAKSNLS